MPNIVTTDSVRAVLGVSAKELPDAVLASPIYATRLNEDLLEMDDSLVTYFTQVGALTSPTPTQQRFLDLVETYAAYNVAQQCLTSLPMFSPLTIKDEKAELTRNQNSYAQLKADVGAVLSLIKSKLLTIYPQVNPNALQYNPTARVFGVSVGIGTDPVTTTS